MSADFEAIYIDNAMLIFISDREELYDDSKHYNYHSIVGNYNYDTDELIIDIAPDHVEEFKKECRAAFEAEMMDKALR
jgi:hypothetical protein